MKKCYKCQIEKSFSEFYKCKTWKDGYDQICITCTKKAHDNPKVRKQKKKYRLAHVEHYNQMSREWKMNNPERFKKLGRELHLRKKFGLTPEQYIKMLETQSGKCYLCGRNNPGNKRIKNFDIDHNKRTGQIRKLLCHPCNSAIGLLNEDTILLNKIIVYLKEHEISEGA